MSIIKYVKLTKAIPALKGTITLDSFKELPEFNNNNAFAEVNVTRFYKLEPSILKFMGMQYLKGAKITVCTPSKKFYKVYQIKPYLVKKHYTYAWVQTTGLPKGLAEDAKFMDRLRKGILDFDLVKKYNDSRLAKCKELNNLNSRDWQVLERFYKELLRDGLKFNICIKSPSEKTWPEVQAELNFEEECARHASAKPLSPEEKALLDKYGDAYGIEVKPFYHRVATRHTRNGYTQEPEVVCHAWNKNNSSWLFQRQRDIKSQQTHDIFKVIPGITDGKEKLFEEVNKGLPGDLKQGYIIKESHSNLNDREAYEALCWFMKNMPDTGLMPEWHRCPVCGEIYHEQEGCPGHIDPIIQIRADKLLYGIDHTYDESLPDFEEDFEEEPEEFDFEEDFEEEKGV